MGRLRARYARYRHVSVALVVALCGVSSRATSQVRARDGDLFARIDRYVQQEMRDSQIPGVAMAIVQDGKVVHQRGFGHDGHGHLITPQTPFPIGSLTKSFTALATKQLSEAGRIGLDDPVQRYLPWFKVADVEASTRMTVRHLLNHTSGLSRALGIEPVIQESQASLQEIVRDLASTPLNRPVGQSYEYSNLNFAVLGLLIETVAAQPWTTYIERHIFAPIGMTNSYTTFDTARREGMTAVHRYWFGLPFRSALTYLPGLAPTGYLAASAEDMGHYLTSYLRKGMASHSRLLSEAGIEEMLTPATNEVTIRLLSTPFTARYGEGWFVGPFGAAGDARWHLGQLPSFTSWMILLPNSDDGVVVLINVGSQMELGGGNSVLSRLPQGVVNLLRNEPPPTGISVTRFYTIVNVIAAVLLGALVWSAARVARSSQDLARSFDETGSWRRAVGTVAPLVWGLGLAVVLLVGIPATIGSSWIALWHFSPDLTAVVLAVAILCAGSGIIRAAQVARWFTHRPPRTHD